MRVLVDNAVLASFRQRAIKAYPVEYVEFLWGQYENGDYVVTVIDRAIVEDADEDEIEFDSLYEYGDIVNGQEMLGSIHTHPNESPEPSQTDLDAAGVDPPEKVFGIMSLEKTKSGRWLTSYGFYDTSGKPVELVISKPEKKRGKRVLSKVSTTQPV